MLTRQQVVIEKSLEGMEWRGERRERGGSATWTRAKLIAVFHRYHTVTVDRGRFFIGIGFSVGIKDSFRLRFLPRYATRAAAVSVV